MPAQVTNYKCPACTGPLHFSSKSGKLECEYCDSTYEVQEMEALYAQAEQKAQEAAEKVNAAGPNGKTVGGETDWGEDAEKMRVYICPSCGAELVCEQTTAATSCPYCGNPTIVPGQFGGVLKPDHVIPFRIDKDTAVKALKAHYKGKVFLPGAFTNSNHIQEIKGIYVPFWLFDGVVDAQVTFDATRSFSRTEGDWLVTTTEHFRVYREGSVAFHRIPVDASTKMPDAHMDSIEPYDYAELKPFSTAYLPGFFADKYDVSVDESAERASRRAVQSTLDSFQRSVKGYETCVMQNRKVELQRGEVKYALLPVWLLSTRWKDQTFLFAMNGQTGKMVGDLPVSWGKFWSLFAGIAVPLAGILALIVSMLW